MSDLSKPSSPQPNNPKQRAPDVFHVPEEEDDAGLVVFRESYMGPLPDPQMLAAYERVIPGLGKEIVQSFQEQGKHRRAMEKSIVEGELSLKRRGQWFGCAVAIFAIAGGATLGIYNQTITGSLAGSLIGTGGVAGLAYVFVAGRRSDGFAEDNE